MKYLLGLVLVGLLLLSFNVLGCDPRYYNQINCAPYYPPRTIIIEVPVQGYGYPNVSGGHSHFGGCGHVGYNTGYGYPVVGARQSRYSRFSISGRVGIGTGHYGHGNRGNAGVGFHYETGKSEHR